MRDSERVALFNLADRRWSLARALVGTALVVFAWMLPPNALAGVVRYLRFFFIVNFLGSVLVVIGLAGLLAPGIFRNAATHESSDPWWSKKIVPLLLTIMLAGSLAVFGYVLRLVI